MRLSAYFTTRNCVEMDYPFEASIKSCFDAFDEIVVCDTGDGLDNTLNILQNLKKEFELNPKKQLKIIRGTANWSAPNSGIYDGLMKGEARSACTGDYLWQQDVDEILEENAKEKIESLIRRLDSDNPLISSTIIEYWGSSGKVRCDVNPWKWRLSKNLPHITHGIPTHLRKTINGMLYANPGTDGCDYIDKNTGQIIPCIHFVKPEIEQLRQRAVHDSDATKLYEDWFNKITDRLPTVYHFSWWSVYSKILKYRQFWNNSWQSLYNETRPPGYNPFFHKSLEEVSDEEMRQMANRLEDECGGYIFHNPVSDPIPKTNHVTINKPVPELAKEWCGNHMLDGSLPE